MRGDRPVPIFVQSFVDLGMVGVLLELSFRDLDNGWFVFGSSGWDTFPVESDILLISSSSSCPILIFNLSSSFRKSFTYMEPKTIPIEKPLPCNANHTVLVLVKSVKDIFEAFPSGPLVSEPLHLHEGHPAPAPSPWSLSDSFSWFPDPYQNPSPGFLILLLRLVPLPPHLNWRHFCRYRTTRKIGNQKASVTKKGNHCQKATGQDSQEARKAFQGNLVPSSDEIT